MPDWKPCPNLRPELRPFVKGITILGGFASPAPMRNLPTGNIQILAQISDGRARCEEGVTHEIYGPQITVIGQRHKYSIYTPSAHTRVLCIEFYPYGAAAFFREPIGNLQDQSVDVAALWAQSGLLTDVLSAGDDDKVFEAVQAELGKRLLLGTDLRQKLNLAQHAIHRLLESKPRSIASLAAELGIHRRGLERLFREYVGTSPGSYARVLRITSAAHLIASPNGLNALDFALDQGYYDQAHFNHDFKAIVGLSPGDYRRSLFPP